MPNHAVVAWIVTAIIVICSTLLSITNHPIPQLLELLGAASVGAAAGVSKSS